MVVLLMALALITNAQAPDLILTNGKIFTSDKAKLYAQALAIKGDRIVAVGTRAEIEKLAGTKTRSINLEGKTVVPGFNDAHDHIGYGAPVSRFIQFNEPMLPGPSLQQLRDSLKLAVRSVPPGTMIQGNIGLRIIEDSTARRGLLDEISPNHPVILNAPWGHGTLLNSKALELLGISTTAPDPVGGLYERLKGSNEISGFLTEYAEFGIIRQWHATLPQSVMVDVFRKYGAAAIQLGITSVQNMATSLDLDKTVSVLKEAALPQRVRVIRFPGTSDKGRITAPWLNTYKPTPMLEVSGMKWILDGTPLERGAFMRTSYSDKPGIAGRMNFPVDTVRRMLKEGIASKEQLMLHIVGDSTPNLVIAEMLRIGNPVIWQGKRVRFEHADGVFPDQYDNARKLGLIAVINPSHFMFAEVNIPRVGERSKTYQPVRSLIEKGIPVAIGSDGPINPFLNIMFAAMHPTNPSEAISPEQAVIAYTLGSAFAEFKEKEKGMLKKGMLADLAVLSQDIFTIPVPELAKTTSLLTIVGGKVVWDAGIVK